MVEESSPSAWDGKAEDHFYHSLSNRSPCPRPVLCVLQQRLGRPQCLSLVRPSAQRLTILSPNVVNKELGKVVSKVVYVFWK